MRKHTTSIRKMSDAALSVYLAGPVQHKADGGAAWRECIEDAHRDIDWLNPLSKYNVPVEGIDIVSDAADADGKTSVTPEDIVSGDKELLRDADVVFVGYSAVRSIGTPMEVMWAYDHYKPVVLWIRDKTPVSDLSPWYRYHADEIYGERSNAIRAVRNAEQST